MDPDDLDNWDNYDQWMEGVIDRADIDRKGEP